MCLPYKMQHFGLAHCQPGFWGLTCAVLQGAVLASSDRGPIRIQFSKNPFGKKRDATGQYVDARMSAGGSGLEGMASFDAQQAAAAAGVAYQQPTMG